SDRAGPPPAAVPWRRDPRRAVRRGRSRPSRRRRRCSRTPVSLALPGSGLVQRHYIHGMRLLLVEDDSMIGEAALDLLRAEHYAVDWVKDGAHADNILRTQDYD